MGLFVSTPVSPGDYGEAEQFTTLRDDVIYNAGDFVEATGGPVNYAVTADASLEVLADGTILKVRFVTPNAGAIDLDVNGLGAKAVKKLGDADTATNDIVADGAYILMFSTPLDAWQILSGVPQSGGTTEITNCVYDQYDRLVSADFNGQTFDFSYASPENDFQLTSFDDGVNVSTIVRDGQGRLTSIIQS